MTDTRVSHCGYKASAGENQPCTGIKPSLAGLRLHVGSIREAEASSHRQISIEAKRFLLCVCCTCDIKVMVLQKAVMKRQNEWTSLSLLIIPCRGGKIQVLKIVEPRRQVYTKMQERCAGASHVKNRIIWSKCRKCP